MSEETRRKCRYYNSGYCKFSRKENGCKNVHPKENCKVFNCPGKACPDRHPKKCKFNVTCRFQSRCSYLHESADLENVRAELNNSEKEVSKLKVEIEMLKTEIDKKVNELSKVYMKELKELQTENVALRQEVEYLSESLEKGNKENGILLNSTQDMSNKI